MDKNVSIIIGCILLLSCSTLKNYGVTPCDTSATTITQKLYSNMYHLATKGFMIGHQDALAYGVNWAYEKGRSDHKDICGDYPAVFGWDLEKIQYHDVTFNIDSVPFKKIREYIIDVYNKGGINTISWHMDNLVTGGPAWDNSSKEVVRSILPGGLNHEKFKRWLDSFVSFISDLKGADGEIIPIIFRPYHELSGSWFWWGKDLCTPQEFISLWQFTFNYLSKTKNVHNLLYSYSMSADFISEKEFMERYPGDNYVDFVGFDNYQGEDINAQNTFIDLSNKRIAITANIAKKRNKIFALTEVGYNTIPDSKWFTQIFYPMLKNKNCSYALFWRNANINSRKNHYFLPYKGHPAANDFKHLVQYDSVFTLSKIGDVYH